MTMKVLTEDQLKEVDRIIENTVVQTTWATGYTDDESSIEVDDVHGTLREAARQVRRYLATIETREVVTNAN